MSSSSSSEISPVSRFLTAPAVLRQVQRVADAHPAAELGREAGGLGLLQQRAVGDRGSVRRCVKVQRAARHWRRPTVQRGGGEGLGDHRRAGDMLALTASISAGGPQTAT